MSTYHIGLSVTYHDSALAIVSEAGEVLFAEATERFLQNKRALNCEPDQLFRIPELLAQYCPNPKKIVIASNWRKKRPIYENIVKNLGILSAPGLLKTGIRKLRSPLTNYQLHHMMACQRSCIERAGLNLVRITQEYHPHCEIEFKDYDHHLTHAAIACYGSPFEEAVCAVIDSYGEHGAMAFYRYRNRKLEPIHEAKGLSKASLGLYYMKITELCGFDWLKGEEWKVMGLASYGKLNQQLYDLLSSIIVVNGFDCIHPAENLFRQLAKLDEFKQRPDTPLEELADVAYTGQLFFADLVTKLLNHLNEFTQCDKLTLAGGCALNSSFNGQISQRTGFKQVYIPPAPADDGCALGAAWLAYHENPPHQQKPPKLQTPYTGSIIKDHAIERLICFNRSLNIQHLPGSISSETARLLADGKLVGWVQGRAEYGPRALGNRSILADPRDALMQDLINEKVKFREMFRPFAPSILHEHADEYFEHYHESPYMDKTLSIRQTMRSKIAAVCHVDGTGRLQTVKREWNPLFYELIEQFYRLTQVPVLLNTSFNIMGKPLVHSLEDALAVFMTTGLDILVVNDYLISKPG
ncbi:nodulation protein NolNO [Methyloglobulus morosus KoM1]|uniref:Nodulation protein NolNO n=1 Tax=Methyloglobulus morosus KoM1 TaxID=1116472 RepID=V5BDF6_9GAMM|nr:carbamoyltransferase C-terminal domain-containing protein [Methyloglobulus morosus]ESS71335.1 nodulation protein NolNO [Methyloglobulus morosus KoM1]